MAPRPPRSRRGRGRGCRRPPQRRRRATTHAAPPATNPADKPLPRHAVAGDLPPWPCLPSPDTPARVDNGRSTHADPPTAPARIDRLPCGNHVSQGPPGQDRRARRPHEAEAIAPARTAARPTLADLDP